MKIKWMIVLLPFFLSSCFKEDERIEPYDRGEKISATLAMTQTYKYQLYYNLNQMAMVSTNNKNDFDLVFDNSLNGFQVFLNTASFSQAAATGKFKMEDVSSSGGLAWRFDASSGNVDSLAFPNWISANAGDTTYTQEVFVMDRGYDDVGNMLGFRKIIFDSLVGQRYYFRYALLNGSDLVSATVEKTGDANFIYFSFVEGKQLFPEPSRTAYDLLFTQYTTLLYTNDGEPYPYLVTGVLLNRFETGCYLDRTLIFDSITMQDVDIDLFTNRPDVIGYDWKEVLGDVNSGNVFYEIRPENNYFLRDQNGIIFKMRFIGYYNNSGEKGYPTIEFQRL